MAGCRARNSLLLAAACLMLVIVSPPLACAGQITGVSVEKSASGDVVRVAMDAMTDYQVYDLKAPARLVLNFPGTTFAQKVSPMKFEAAGVSAVTTTQSSEGARLEIALDRPLAYHIEEQGKALHIRFSGVANEGIQHGKSAAELVDLEVRDQSGITELVVRGKQMNASHNAYVTNDGGTMILDFWGGVSRLPKEFYSFSSRRVRSVTVGEAEGRTRLVINLVPGVRVPHQIEATNARLTVRFGDTTARHGAVVVEDVAFQPVSGQATRLTIRTNVSNPVVNLYEKNGNMMLDIDKAVLAKGQERSLDVREFPGPVSQVDAYRVGNGVRVVARLREKASFSSFQHGNVLTVTLASEQAAKAAAGGKGEVAMVYSGKPVSFDFKDIDIRNALKMIAELSGFNIIMADDVNGTLTMHLVDVPWDQALDLILAAKGLGKEQMGNVVRIVPLAALRAEQEARLKVQQGNVRLAPLVTEYITLNFAKAEDVLAMLQGSQQSESANQTGTEATTTSGTSPSGGGTSQQNATTMLSKRGSVQADTRTNTLIITDTQNSVDNIKRLIEVLDKPVQQVLIEARIVEATDNFTRSLGIRWGGQFNKQGVTNGFPNSVTVGATPTGSTVPARGFLVDLPATGVAASGGAVGVTLGSLSGALNLDLELSAAEADSDIKIVSNPRLITANMQEAYIKQGTKVPIVTPATTTEPASTELVDAVLELKVTPQITANGNIILDVFITKDAPTTVNNLTGISTKEIRTNALLRNGETMVIGGIYTRENNVADAGVPGLKDIPLLGWLFKNKTKTDNRTELLIFLTPKIIEQEPVKSARAASL